MSSKFDNRQQYFKDEHLDLSNGYPERDLNWFNATILPNFLKLKEEINLESDLLDLGCASGYFTNLLSPHFNKTCGIDFTENRIQHAQKSYENDHTCFKQGDITSDSISDLFPNNKFRTIYTSAVIPHIPLNRKHIVFENLFDSTEPGAILVMYDGIAHQDRDIFVGMLSEEYIRNIKGWELLHIKDISHQTKEIVLQKK